MMNSYLSNASIHICLHASPAQVCERPTLFNVYYVNQTEMAGLVLMEF
jgi:hypothetical protein